MRNALLFVTIYRGPVGVYLSVSARLFALDWYRETLSRIGETLSCIGEALSRIGIGWDLWSSIGWDFWIGIGWREHLDGIGWDFWIGIISWKLGFLNKYRLEPLEMKPVVSVATFGNETCSL
ncbi:uncharacterized protein OCT59_026256 [Rhizophagus irregularis]|uniref:uncharacterized protein n=1 Tax=Rhizophagus irregularis TaxID=588596 RepID=UPI00331AF1D8|nr:hypothetical protein OCT59_026256 [Rhizophagus irregularis]